MTRAGIYVRISDDRNAESVGVARQEADARAYADRRGWDVTTVYRENDTSAFRRRKVTLPDGTTAMRVVRPEFRRLLADLAEGTIDALVGYDLDRVARDPRDLEDLIDVVEHRGSPAVSVTGSLDLSNDAGITMARVMVAVANKSSRDTSRRVRRAKEDAAARGRWNGGGKRAYGWTPDRTALVPEEAAVVRGAAARVLAGDSVNAVVADLAASGAPTAYGRPWARSTLRTILTRPATAGLLVHRGQVVGDAPWPAILDRDTWQQVVDELAKRPRHDQALAHWLTGLLRCARCGGVMRGNQGGYVCDVRTKGCGRMWVRAGRAEAFIAETLMARLEHAAPPPVVDVAPPPDDSQLVELAAMWGRREISLAEYRAAREAIVAQLRDATPRVVRLPAWAREDLRGQWPDLDVVRRRTVAASLLEAVLVHPSPDRQWHPERLELRWL